MKHRIWNIPNSAKMRAYNQMDIDYSHKYGIGYYLSNNSMGMLFNDDTKMIHNLTTDKLHYFNSLDLLMYDFENYSSRQHNDFSKDLKKKLKIMNYMKKVMRTKNTNNSIADWKSAHFDKTVIFLKKWSNLDKELVFKLNSKLMHIVVSDKKEILLKYDTGIASYFWNDTKPTTVNLPDEIRSMIFSNTVSLRRKIDAVQSLFYATKQSNYEQSQNDYYRRKTSVYTTKLDHAFHEKSTKGFSSDVDFDYTPKIRTRMYNHYYSKLDAQRSLNSTPYKNSSRE